MGIIQKIGFVSQDCIERLTLKAESFWLNYIKERNITPRHLGTQDNMVQLVTIKFMCKDLMFYLSQSYTKSNNIHLTAQYPTFPVGTPRIFFQKAISISILFAVIDIQPEI